MSPIQQKELQELGRAFSQGYASPKQIKQLSELLSQINRAFEKPLNVEDFIKGSR